MHQRIDLFADELQIRELRVEADERQVDRADSSHESPADDPAPGVAALVDVIASGAVVADSDGSVATGLSTVTAREYFTQDIATVPGLSAPARIKRDIQLSLDPPLEIPIGLAVANQEDLGHAPTVPLPSSTVAGCRSSR